MQHKGCLEKRAGGRACRAAASARPGVGVGRDSPEARGPFAGRVPLDDIHPVINGVLPSSDPLCCGTRAMLVLRWKLCRLPNRTASLGSILSRGSCGLVLRDCNMQVLPQPPPSDAGAQLFFQQPRYQPAGPTPLPMGPPLPLTSQPPLPAGPAHARESGHPALPPASLAYQQQHQQGATQTTTQQQQQQQQQQPGGKRKKRGRRGSGLDSRSRGVQKQRCGSTQLGFFGQMPSLSDMRQENWRRTQQHYGSGSAAAPGIAGPLRPFPGASKQHHGRQLGHGKAARRGGALMRSSRAHPFLPAAPFFLADAPMCLPPYVVTGSSRAGSHRRARNKASKQAKLLHPPSAPRPKPLTPAGESSCTCGHPSGPMLPPFRQGTPQADCQPACPLQNALQ